MAVNRDDSAPTKGKRTHLRISFALAKGYAAWGVRYCWGNPVNYDAGPHRTLADAKAAVENVEVVCVRSALADLAIVFGSWH